MAMRQEQYKQTGLQLLPTGSAWDKSDDSELGSIMNAFAKMLARIDTQSEVIASEAVPSRSLLLLSDYETFLALPDDFLPSSSTASARQLAVKRKLTTTGSLSKNILIDIAKELGYTIKIIEKHPHHCLRDINYPLYPNHNWWLIWIYVDGLEVSNTTIIDDITNRLTTKTGVTQLGQALERYKPAHINLIYVNEE